MANNQRKRGNGKNSMPKFGGVKRSSSKKKKVRKPMNPVVRKVLTVFCILFAIGVVCATVACTYVISYAKNYVYGEKVIDLDDYRANQQQTSIIYAYDEDKTKIRSTRPVSTCSPPR